jgi:hypothetical protein
MYEDKTNKYVVETEKTIFIPENIQKNNKIHDSSLNIYYV